MRSFLSIVFIFLCFFLNAQMFSKNKNVFRQEAINKLRSIGTEPARKIAFDFQNSWDGKFTSAQQDKAHDIALKMQKNGYKF